MYEFVGHSVRSNYIRKFKELWHYIHSAIPTKVYLSVRLLVTMETIGESG